ncbi:bifunctional diguanylate cyclase/phosphodiesterase [bacterium]|nr:bifunctional diguanylate cyclase/phosphodiesterase [bacterium]
MILPAAIMVYSIAFDETWNFPPLIAVEALLVAGFFVSKRLSHRGFDILIHTLLVLTPLAYAWGAFAPGNHQTYVVVLLCIPPFFDNLAPRRTYWAWFSYALAVVTLVLCSSLFGYPSAWEYDFTIAIALMLHMAFLILWALRYVTRRQIERYMVEFADGAVKDKLTRLPTLVAFRDSFGGGRRLLVCLIAVSNFRELSTLFGYSLSTEVLLIAATRLRETEAQLGGSAFSLRGHDFGYVRELAEDESAPDIVAAIQRFVAGPMAFQGKTIELNYRIGYTVNEDGNPEKSLDEAEEAFDFALRRGFDIAAYSGSWKGVTEAEAAVADLMTLSRNLSENTLTVFYQPVIALSSGRTSWNEALARFKGRGDYFEETSRFMELASTTGHWSAIEDFMFAHAADRACGRGGPVSINVGLRDLERADFLLAIEDAAGRAKAAGSAIILEILESDIGSLENGRLQLLKRLRQAGCLIAIDDFGTGYSNYSRLLTMPVDIIKFDKSLIYSARKSKPEATLIRGLLRFCYDIGALTVAEGIETKDLAEFALSLGFDFGQGYFWSRPVPEDRAVKAERTPLLASRITDFGQ